MPEGDTIYRTARTLDRALAGRTVTVFETMLPFLQRVHDGRPITGRVVTSVRPAGKHLLMEFSGDLILRTHMRMSGSWHVYRPGERWLRARSSMRIVVGNEDYVAVAFDVPVAEFLSASDVERHAGLRALGPDLLAESFDVGTAVARLRAGPGRSIAEALLDQRVAAGIGNVYKSEVLFVCGIDPFREVGSLSDLEARALFGAARKLLKANVAEGREPREPAARGRRTTGSMNPGAKLWVYGRGGRPCRRCGREIASRGHGADARLTFWCPRCQR